MVSTSTEDGYNKRENDNKNEGESKGQESLKILAINCLRRLRQQNELRKKSRGEEGRAYIFRAQQYVKYREILLQFFFVTEKNTNEKIIRVQCVEVYMSLNSN